MDYSQYGLTQVDAKSSDHDKGIVAAPDGTFYKIDGFKREQKEGLDTDQGGAFSGKLQADSAKGGWNPSTFNTATDVENALKYLEEPEPEKDYSGDQDNIELSERLATARARVAQYEEDRVSGQMAKDLYDSENNPSEGFLERYKIKLGEQLANGKYKDPRNNPSKPGEDEESSINVSKFARTGIAER